MSKWYKTAIHIIGVSIFTLAFAFTITWTLSKVPILAPITDSVLDFEFTDQAFKNRDYHSIPLDTNLFIVNVANYSRYQLATIIDTVNQQEPNSICLSVIFKNRKQQFVDSILENSLKNVNNLFFIGGFVEGQISSSHDSFTQYGKISSGNLVYGLKNSIRDFSTSSEFNGEKYHHMALAASAVYNSEVTSKFLERNNELETINYIGDVQKYPVIDFNSAGKLTVYTANDAGYLRPDSALKLQDLKDKIVLFGFITEDISKFDPAVIDPIDAYSTPLPYILSWLGESNLPNIKAVVIHANIFSTILNGKYINRSWTMNIVINILVVILSTALFLYVSQLLPKHYGLITKTLALLIILVLIVLTITIFKNFSYKYDPRWAILVLLFLSDSSEIYIQYVLKRA